MTKETTIGSIVLVIVGIALFIFSGHFSPSSGAVSRAPNVDAQFRSVTITGVADDTGLSFASGLTQINGILTQNAGQIRSYTNATSTSKTSQTLVQADILHYDTVSMKPLVGALTVTFPATSTLTSFVPATGDMEEQCWLNSTTTAAATISFVAGTGIDFENTATTSPLNGGFSAPAPIPALGTGCFKFIRQANTDITAAYTGYINAD